MTTVVSNIMEMITVEIINEIGKNIIVTCVYRKPGSHVEQFTDKITEIFDKIQSKTVFVVILK